MKKRILSFLLAAIMIVSLLPTAAFAAAAESDFEFDTTYGYITGYKGAGGNVEIPATIGGQEVKQITSPTGGGTGAFAGNTAVTGVTIPAGVTGVTNSAFKGCTNLATVTFAEGSKLSSLNYGAFDSCTSLQSITLPSSITIIGAGAFQSSGLTSIVIPENVWLIGSDAFKNCADLTSIDIPASVTNIQEEVFTGSGITSVTVHWDSADALPTSLNADAFKGITTTATLHVPQGVKSVYQGATGWSDFTTIVDDVSSSTPGSKARPWKIGATEKDNVTAYLDSGTLHIEGAGAMQDFTQAGSSIDSPWYADKGNIKAVVIDSGVTSIGSNAFRLHSNLTSVTIPASVVSIGSMAFAQCSKLESVTIPENVTSIGASAFQVCSKLASVTVLATNPPEVGNNAFANCSIKEIRVPGIALGAYKNATDWKVPTSTPGKFVEIMQVGGTIDIDHPEYLEDGEAHKGQPVTITVHAEEGYILSMLAATYELKEADKQKLDASKPAGYSAGLPFFYTLWEQNLHDGDTRSFNMPTGGSNVVLTYLFEKDPSVTVDANHKVTASQLGVTSRTWKADLETMVSAMKADGRYTGTELDLSPWVTNEDTSVFGEKSSDEALDYIKQMISTNELNVMTTRITFPKENYTTIADQTNTVGYSYGLKQTDNPEALYVGAYVNGRYVYTLDAAENKILVPAYMKHITQEWEDCEEVFEERLAYTEKAAKLTQELGVKYLTVNVGYPRINEDVLLTRMEKVCAACAKYGVTVLIESVDNTLYLNNLIIRLLNAQYNNVGFCYTAGDIRITFWDDVGKQYQLIKPWIRAVRVRDCPPGIDQASEKWNTDCVWGDGLVSSMPFNTNQEGLDGKKYRPIERLVEDGFTGPILYDYYTSGEETLTDTRKADIKLAMDRILKDIDGEKDYLTEDFKAGAGYHVEVYREEDPEATGKYNLFFTGKGEIWELDETLFRWTDPDSVNRITILDDTITGVSATAFKDVGSQETVNLTLPNGWKGAEPDKDGNWYGAKNVVLEAEEEPTGKTLPYSFDFETDFLTEGWTVVDSDGDGRNWRGLDDSYTGHTGNYCAFSESYVYNSSTGSSTNIDADNWLISPAIALQANNKINWFVQSAYGPSYPDAYAVYIGTTDSVDGMTQIYPASGFVDGESAWTEHTVDIPASYDGKTVYIAFHHKDYAQYALLLDDVTVTGEAAPANPYWYVDEKGEKVVIDAGTTTVTEINSSTTNWSGIVFATGSVTIGGKVTLNDDTTLILADGASLTLNDGITAGYNSYSLTICGQTLDSGKLTVSKSNGIAADVPAGSVTVNGGEVNISATGDYAVGVYSSVTVNGGKVEISGPTGVSGNVTVSGGKVEISAAGENAATGVYGNVTVSGGEVTIEGNYSGQQGLHVVYGVQGNVTVSGGKVAISGTGTKGDGVGIYFQSSPIITVTNDGELTVYGKTKAITNGTTVTSEYVTATVQTSTDGNTWADWDGEIPLENFKYLKLTALSSLPKGAEWLVDEGDNQVWYKLENNVLTIGGTGEFSDLDAIAIQDKASVEDVIISDSTVTVAGTNAFADIVGALLTLPDGWQGELPDDEGKWYGGYVEMSAIPTAVKNVTFLQRWPWNEKVDIAFTMTGKPGETNVVITIKDGTTVLASIPLTVEIPDSGVLTENYLWENAKTALAANFNSKNVTVEVAKAQQVPGQLWAGGPVWADSNLGDSEVQSHPEYGALYTFSDAGTAVTEGWRLPTKDDFDNLLANCEREWNDTNKGNTFTGKGDYSSQSIFLPAAGFSDGESQSRFNMNSNGYYWSSASKDDRNAFALYLYAGASVMGSDRTNECSVRLVQDVTPAISATSEIGTIDLRTSIALPEKSVTVAAVTWSDTAWNTPGVTAEQVTIGWKNMDTEETGVLAMLTGEGISDYNLPQKDGNYKLTHSAGELLSAATFTVSGYPVCAITNGTATEDAHGSITISTKSGAENETITVTVSPDTGYALKSLKYNDGSDHEITKDATTGNYQFTMPAKAVTVTAEFIEIPAAPAAGEGYTIDYENEVIVVETGYEVSKSSDPFTAEALTDNELAIEPGTTYSIRKAAVEGESLASAATGFTAPARPAAPTAGVGYEIDYENEVIVVETGYEVSKSSDPFTAEALTDNELAIEPGTTYSIRKAAVEGESFASAATGFTAPARPAAPASAPALVSVTDTTVTVSAAAGQEYSIDNGQNWVSGTDGKVTFTGLEAAGTYSIISRAKAVTTTGSEAFAGANSPALTGYTAQAALENAEEGYVLDYVEEKISVADPCEVSTKNGTASGETFEENVIALDSFDVTPGTTYYIRMKAVEGGAPASAAVSFTIPARPAAPAAGEGYEVDCENEVIIVENGYEISKSSDPFEAETLTDDALAIEPGETYYIRKAAVEGESLVSEAAAIETAARSEAPEKTPGLEEKTDTSITVEAKEGQEYSIDGGTTWETGSDGKVTFTGLTPNTEYNVITRKAAVTTEGSEEFASENSVASVITTKSAEASKAAADPVDVVNGEIISSGEKVEVKGADGEDIPEEKLVEVAGKINEVLDNEAVKTFGEDEEGEDETGLEEATKNSNDKIVDALKAQTSDPTAQGNVSETDISKFLNVTLVSASVDVDTEVAVTAMVFDVTPMATITVTGSDGEVTLTTEITNDQIDGTVRFLLPVDRASSVRYAAVYHEDAFIGNYEIKTDGNGNKYIEIETDSFSEFSYIILDETTACAKIGDMLYARLSDAVSEVENDETITLLKDASGTITVSREVKFTVDDNGKTNDAEIVAGDGYTLSEKDGTYTITAIFYGENNAVELPAEVRNGKVEVSPKTAVAGQTVTVTVTPDKGYTLETLTVLDKDGKEISVKALGNNKYSFTMPDSKTAISAAFMEDNTMLNFCVDVKAKDYYYDAVLWAYKNGITDGVDNVHFAPDGTVTRAQAVTLLWRAAGCPVVNYAMQMTDVEADAWYTEAVRWALSTGVTKGTSETTFDPNAVCTRAQVVTFLARAAGIKDADTASVFSDVKSTDYFAAAVKWAKDNKVTEGTSATTFSPAAACTRAQVVTFLYRWMVK